MDWDLFVGRFHPLVVHFPVALLMAAALMEMLTRIKFFRPIGAAIPFILFLGALTAFLSMLLGWLIAGDRGYDEGTLFWHRWLGVSVFSVSVVLCLVSIGVIRVGEKLRLSFFILIFILVSLTGHLGGALTHGENYLSEYAPEFLQRFLQSNQPEDQLTLHPNPDSVVVFRDLISPILIAECTPCHDENQHKGGLHVTTIEALRKGGDTGPAVVPGNSTESELFRRISLPVNHPKFMPLRKTPLSFSKVNILRWWIDQGASPDATLTASSIDHVREYLLREYSYEPIVRPYYEITSVGAADPEKLYRLVQQGFKITALANGSNYLSVMCPQPSLTVDQLQELLSVAEQVTWLDVSNSGITDDHIDVLTEFVNLTRLNLHSNPVSDIGIRKLKALPHLEILNLYKTAISDNILMAIAELPSLKRVYVWQTRVSPDAVKELIEKKPTLQVDTGFQFVE